MIGAGSQRTLGSGFESTPTCLLSRLRRHGRSSFGGQERVPRWWTVHGEAKGDDGSAVGGVGGGGRPTVFGRDGRHDGKAQTGAGAGTSLVGLPEALEEMGLRVGIEPGTVVANGQDGRPVDQPGADLDRRARRGVTQRVGDEVGDRLA